MHDRTAAVSLLLFGLVMTCPRISHATPNVPGFTVQNYVSGILKPYRLAFSPAGVLFVGNNTNVSPEWADRVPVGGGSFSPYGTIAYSDPDAVVFDETGSISGTPGVTPRGPWAD